MVEAAEGGRPWGHSQRLPAAAVAAEVVAAAEAAAEAADRAVEAVRRSRTERPVPGPTGSSREAAAGPRPPEPAEDLAAAPAPVPRSALCPERAVAPLPAVEGGPGRQRKNHSLADGTKWSFFK